MFSLSVFCSLSFYTKTFDFGILTSGDASVFASTAGVSFMGISVMSWAMALIFIGGAGKVGHVPFAHLVARCYGRPYACFGIDSCCHYGCCRGLSGGTAFPCICLIYSGCFTRHCLCRRIHFTLCSCNCLRTNRY